MCVIFSIDVSYVLFCHTGGHVTVAAVMKLGRLLYTILVHEVSVCVQGLHQEAVIKKSRPKSKRSNQLISHTEECCLQDSVSVALTVFCSSCHDLKVNAFAR